MSPILDIQYRLRELGRIRMGIKVKVKGKKDTLKKLDTWRLTSASKELLDSAAERYGGEVRVWKDAPNEGEHFELITESDVLDIVIPPNDAAFSQWMEMWSGGGCQKRCDGQRQVLVDRPCSCPKDPQERKQLATQGKACKETTRFNVLLPDIQDVGVWRLETHGYYAAVELAAFQQLAQLATSRGQMIRARLRIDHRTAKKINAGKSQTHRYTVPVVEVSHTVGDVLAALGADVTDVAISLPAPVEARNLPDDRPALPDDADGWGADDGEHPEWLEHLLMEHSATDIIEATRAEIEAAGASVTVNSLHDIHDVPDDWHAVIERRVKEPKVEAGSSSDAVSSDAADEGEPQASEPTPPSSAGDDASPPSSSESGGGAEDREDSGASPIPPTHTPSGSDSEYQEALERAKAKADEQEEKRVIERDAEQATQEALDA